MAGMHRIPVPSVYKTHETDQLNPNPAMIIYITKITCVDIVVIHDNNNNRPDGR